MKLVVNTGLNQTGWDQFILNHPQGNLLQSWAWGDFQESLGNPIWRFSVQEEDKTIAQLLMIKLSLGFGKSIFYSPRDLLINKTTSAHFQHQAAKLILEEIKQMSKKENVILFRIEPPTLSNDTTANSFYQSLRFVRSNKNIQPQENLVIDLQPELRDILNQMKPKTRYNIGLAQKKHVQVDNSMDNSTIETFIKLNHETSSRDGFIPHSDNYYRKQFSMLSRANLMNLFIASVSDTPVSAALVSVFGKQATYLHGASSNLYREAMPTHALQWTAIEYAKQQGCLTYDLGGIDTAGKRPAWAGITRFKEGFGGNVVKYTGMWELPLDKFWFKIYRFINLIKR